MLRLFTLAYNKPELVREAVEHYASVIKADPPRVPYTWHLVDCHWPEGDMPANTKNLMRLADEFGLQCVVLPKNMGVAGNWDWFTRYMHCQDQDIFVGLDPDERIEPGFLNGLVDVFQGDPMAFYACACPAGSTPESYRRFGYRVVEQTFGNTRAFSVDRAAGWPIGGFSGRWINRIGGVFATHPVYGYIESEMFRLAQAIHPQAVSYFLQDTFSQHLESDPMYTRWKLECAQHKTDKDYSEWLKTNYEG